ncbi:hypothetical protein QFC22_006662 [Naganishia vaughanmartiniae]|uniref:Uncharacterized protein n=1 Tax=Naganishia vaughanmartiniae TaxID=1424756 RepID=A0ACC2WIC2_9TREE|nr:hypothetical protein QFC22_006662 [Naganishia vaughanmartiniae]
MALGEWEKAVEKYADALEIMRGIHGEVAAELAPLLLPYGKALFEVACRQTGVLGKADAGAEEPEEKGPVGKAAQFTFEGDEDDDEEEQPEEGAAEGGEGQGAADGAEGDDDDFTVAWEVLDLARTLFEKQDLRLVAKDLGETYAVLGDVSLETENFPQAVEDYTSALKTFHQCLPATSREIASSHYRLAIVLESLSDKKQEAIENVEKAIESVQARKTAIERGLDPDHVIEEDYEVGGHKLRAHKGKGKGKEVINHKTSVLTEEERKKQVSDCEEQLKDLQLKLEDLKTAPEREGIVEDTIAHLLGNTPAASGTAGQAMDDIAAKVNDLTSMVKKKARKTADQAGVPTTTKGIKKQVSAVQEQAVDQASTIKDQVVDQAAVLKDQVAEQASTLTDKAVDQASTLKDQAVDQASVLKDQVVEQASALKDIAADRAATLADQVVDQASTYKDIAADQASTLGGQVVDQATVLKDQLMEQASSAAVSLQVQVSEGAQVAAESLTEKAQSVLAQAHHTVDELMKAGTSQAQHAIGAIKSAANGIVQEIMDEGKQVTQESVEAVQGVLEDVKEGKEKAVHVAEDLAKHAQQTAHAGLDAAKHAGESIVQEIMEEGQEATREAVEAVTGTAEDVLGGIEAIGREGKRKVEELKPEEAVEESHKKQRTQ